MANAPTIIDLIRNGTLSTEMAATLWTAVSEKNSFISAAVPRLAGKTTTAMAVLDLLPPSVPVNKLDGTIEDMDAYRDRALGGYLTIAEISEGRFQDYIWGEETRHLFETLNAGYSFMATLHADSVEDVFAQICQGNGISDEAASRIGFAFYILRFGEDESNFWRRVAAVYEIDRVEGGKPTARLLHRWLQADDRFESVESPRTLSATPQQIAARATALKSLLDSGNGSPNDIEQLAATFAE